MSKPHSIKTIQRIPITIEEAWDFFSRPDNLQAITPPQLRFNIISQHHGNHMYAGQIIEYNVRPLAGIPLYWMTEITHVSDKKYFVDEQRFGPYRLWHHQHHFTEINGGVEMMDLVHYQLPFGFLGDMAHVLWVGKQLKEIFRFREEAVVKKFGNWPH